MQINLHLIKFKWSSKHILREGRVGFKLGKLSQGLIETKRQQLEAPRTFQRMVLLQSASRKLNLHVASSQLLSSGLQLCFSCPSFLSPLCFQPDPEDKLKGIPPSPWSRELGGVRVGSIGLSLWFQILFDFLGSLGTPEPRDFLLTVSRLRLRHTPSSPGPCGPGSACYICIDPLP